MYITATAAHYYVITMSLLCHYYVITMSFVLCFPAHIKSPSYLVNRDNQF